MPSKGEACLSPFKSYLNECLKNRGYRAQCVRRERTLAKQESKPLAKGVTNELTKLLAAAWDRFSTACVVGGAVGVIGPAYQRIFHFGSQALPICGVQTTTNCLPEWGWNEWIAIIVGTALWFFTAAMLHSHAGDVLKHKLEFD